MGGRTATVGISKTYCEWIYGSSPFLSRKGQFVVLLEL